MQEDSGGPAWCQQMGNQRGDSEMAVGTAEEMNRGDEGRWHPMVVQDHIKATFSEPGLNEI